MSKTDMSGSGKKQEVNPEEAALVQGGCSDMVESSPLVMAAVGEVAGDIDNSDVKFPRLDFVYGVGELCQTFQLGDIVYNSEVLLASKTVPIQVTVLSLTKYFQEALPYDPSGEIRPRIFNTLEEAQKAGLITDWSLGKPQINSCAHIILAIEAPESVDDTLFPLMFTEPPTPGDVNEEPVTKAVALGALTVRNTTYTKVAKPIISARAFSKDLPLMRSRWELKTVHGKAGKHTGFVPNLRMNGINSAAYIKFLSEAVGG